MKRSKPSLKLPKKKPPKEEPQEPEVVKDKPEDKEPKEAEVISLAMPTGTAARDAEGIPEHWRPRPMPEEGKLLVIEDHLAQKQIEMIMHRLDTSGVSLEDSVALMVRAMVDASIDFSQVRRAFKQTMAHIGDRMEILMVAQATKYLAAEVESAKMLDTLQEELVDLVRTPALDPRVKVSAFNALVKWTESKRDFSFKTAKLLQDTKLVDRVADIFQNFVRMAEEGDTGWESLLDGMPPEERRDMALIVKWMVRAEGIDFEGVAAYLETRDGN